MLYLSDFYCTANLKYILKEQRKPDEYVKGKKNSAQRVSFLGEGLRSDKFGSANLKILRAVPDLCSKKWISEKDRLSVQACMSGLSSTALHKV